MNYEWSKTDTAAVMFSAINSCRKSRICRIAVVLKEEEVDPVRLKQAVALIMPRFPAFLYRGREGFFWAYLERTDFLPDVLPETLAPTALRRLGRDGKPELQILYYGRRISVEGSHINADGTGFAELAKSIVAEYLILGGANPSDFAGVRLPDMVPAPQEYENSYIRYFTDEKLKTPARPKAYHIKANIVPGYSLLLSGLMPSDAVKAPCKNRGLTVTDYLVARLIHAIIITAPAPIEKSIVISVPVNMRKFFPTDTVRNFSSDTCVVFNPEGRTDIPFEEILNSIKGQIKAGFTEENMQAFINSTYGLILKPYLRVFPYFIKKPVLNAAQWFSHTTGMTAVFSNLGNMAVPDGMARYIERIDASGGDARVYGMDTFISATGINGFINVTFSLSGGNTALATEFFRELAADGISIRVETSDPVGADFRLSGVPKKCPACGVETGEEYTVCPLCGNSPIECEPKVLGFKTAAYPNPGIIPSPGKYSRKHGKGFLKAYFNI